MARLVKYPAVAPFQRLSLPAATGFESERARRLMVTGLLYVLARALADSCRRSKKICNSTLTKANPSKDGARLVVYWQIASSVINRGSISDRERPTATREARRSRAISSAPDRLHRCGRSMSTGTGQRADVSQHRFRLPNEDAPALAPIPIAARERPSNSARIACSTIIPDPRL